MWFRDYGTYSLAKKLHSHANLQVVEGKLTVFIADEMVQNKRLAWAVVACWDASICDMVKLLFLECKSGLNLPVPPVCQNGFWSSGSRSNVTVVVSSGEEPRAYLARSNSVIFLSVCFFRNPRLSINIAQASPDPWSFHLTRPCTRTIRKSNAIFFSSNPTSSTNSSPISFSGGNLSKRTVAVTFVCLVELCGLENVYLHVHLCVCMSS